MSADFITRSIGDLPIHIGDGNYSGKYPKASDFLDSGVPFISASDFLDGRITSMGFRYISEEQHLSLKKGHLKSGDVLIVTRGNGTGDVAWVDYQYAECNINAQLVLLRSDEVIVHNKFLYYLLSSKEYKEIFVSYSSGSAQPQLPIKALKLVELRLPTYRSQVKIANLLSSADNKIHLNTKTNQTLESIAQAIFKSWFVDFDPVKAKITALETGGTQETAELAAMCVISGKGEAQLARLKTQDFDAYQQLARTAALFPAAMQESELGEIPAGWGVNQISEFGLVICGKTPSKSEPKYFGLGVPFIKIPDMHNEVYVVNPIEQLTKLGSESQKNKTIPPGSVCVSSIATVGKVVIAHEPSQTNQQINSIVPKKSEYTFYLFFQMKSKNQEFHDLASGGSATLNMNTSTFSKVKVLMPNEEILDFFESTVSPAFKNILRGQRESKELAELRDSLLPKLLSGEIVLDMERV